MPINLAADVAEHARSRPGAAAFLLDDRTQDWATTADRVARIAGALAARGVRRGDRVALLGRNSALFFEALLACAWAGAIALPLNWRLTANELAFQLGDATPALALVDREFLPLVDPAAAGGVALTLETDGAAMAAGPDRLDAPVVVGADDVFGIFFTGGTTGLPKGVMLTHGNVRANTENVRQLVPYAADDVHLHAAPMFHLADLGYTFVGLAAGCRHAFLGAFTPGGFLASVARHGVTISLLAPAMVTAIVRDPALAAHDVRSLRRITYGGAPMPAETLARALDVLACDFYQGFGQTEATHTIATLTAEDHRRIATTPALAASCGRAAPGIEISIRDDAGRSLPAGTPGEVCARGRTIMPGYWRREAETAKALADGWLHTGDVGVLDADGYLTLLDRKKDMIVTGAENVYSVEVENALSTHPAVAECAVIAVPDDRWGERVHAVVVLRAGMTADDDTLRDHCRASIGGYKVPRSFEFVERLPRSAHGKVQKDQLRAPHWAGRSRAIG